MLEFAPKIGDGNVRKKEPMQPRRTILFIEQNLDGTTGGSYRSLLHLVRRVDRSLYRPVVAFYRDHDLMPRYRATGCEILLLRYPSPVDLRRAWSGSGSTWGVPLRGLASFVQRVANLFRMSTFLLLRNLYLITRKKIDLVHLNNGVTDGSELLLAAKLLGRKVVIHQRGIGPVPRWNARFASWADHIICVSDSARHNLVAAGIPRAKCTTVHNGIDPDEFLSTVRRSPAEVRRSLGLAEDCPVVGMAGMIRAWKGQLVLLEAIRLLHAEYPGLRCVIAGGVADRDDKDRMYLEGLRRFIADNGLETTVQILDYQPNVAEFLQVLDVMVHAAVDPEPFSRTVLEGMTLGRALVATSTGGTPEAIQDGVSGILVPPNDSEAMAAKIGFLLDHPEERRRLGLGAQEAIRQKFLITANVAATERIYRSLFERGTAPHAASR